MTSNLPSSAIVSQESVLVRGSSSHKPRFVWLDVARIFACFMVILMHSPLPANGFPNLFVSVYNYVTSPCIGLFFMISGALLLPVEDELGHFLKKRLMKVLTPLLVWSFFYAAIAIAFKEATPGSVIIRLLLLPFSPFRGVLWFVYTLVGLYLFAPIISKWLLIASKRQLHFYLLLWAITLCYPYMSLILPERLDVDGSYYDVLFEFSGYMGYMVFGHYLFRFPITSTLGKRLWIWQLAAYLISTLIPFAVYLSRLPGVPNSLFYNYLTINVALMAAVIFTLLQKIDIRSRKLHAVIRETSIMTFGIYLVHIFILRKVVWPFFANYVTVPTIFEVLAMAISTFLLCYFVVKLISLLPWSTYIIGK